MQNLIDQLPELGQPLLEPAPHQQFCNRLDQVLMKYQRQIKHLRQSLVILRKVTNPAAEKQVTRGIELVQKTCLALRLDFNKELSGLGRDESLPEPNKKMLVQGFSLRLKECLQEERECDQAIRTAIQQKLERQLQTINPNFQHEELHGVLAEPEKLNRMIHETVMKGTNRKLGYVVQDMLEKRQQMERLAEKVRENLELLKDIEILINEQGGYLRTIESMLKKAEDNVNEALPEIEQASDQVLLRNRTLCCILVVCLLAVAGVVAIWMTAIFAN